MTCPEFSPTERDRAKCTCQKHWNDHTQAAKSSFMQHSAQKLIELVIDAVRRDQTDPCPGYWPGADWPQGSFALPDCICGRPATISHTPGDVLTGIRGYRLLTHTTTDICGQFYGTVSMPGTCGVCNAKWIEHPPKARSLAIEAFPSSHTPNCACITHNGDIECDCMTYPEKQAALDKLGKKEPKKMSCRKFKSKSAGSTKCRNCEDDFHRHSLDARDGHDLFQPWRAAHFTDFELIEFLQELGKDRPTRISTLKKLLVDPHFSFVRSKGAPCPDTHTIGAFYEALTGEHIIISPKDEAKYPQAPAKRGPALLAAINKYYCCGCGIEEVTIHGDACPECADFYARQGTPATTSGRPDTATHEPHQGPTPTASGGPAAIDPD